MDESEYQNGAGVPQSRWGWTTKLTGLGIIIMGGTVFYALGRQDHRQLVAVMGGVSLGLGLALLLGWKGIKLVLTGLHAAGAKQSRVKF